MDLMPLGAIVMASLTAALFFLRFWKHTHDRFFSISPCPSASKASTAPRWR